MDDFVTPAIVRLPLSGGQFIDIAKRLTHGETEDMYARMSFGGELSRRDFRTAKIVAYLVGWSLTKDGTPVPMSRDLSEQARIDTIRSLDPDRAVELYQAIDAHEEVTDKARAEQKKILSGSPLVGPTSPLPSAVAGDSTGFVN